MPTRPRTAAASFAAAAILAAIALTGCASTGTTSTPSAAQEQAAANPSAYGVNPSDAGPTAPIAAATSAPPPAPTAEPSSGPCTTHACIAAIMDKDALGIVAENNSVVTGAKCKPSTVRHNPGDTWTARCTITYSDDTKGHGLLTLAPDKSNGGTQVAFQPDGT